jgi:hypothetical protein
VSIRQMITIIAAAAAKLAELIQRVRVVHAGVHLQIVVVTVARALRRNVLVVPLVVLRPHALPTMHAEIQLVLIIAAILVL